MSEREYYTGIDQMRFAAALLVIAIHTSPLSSISAIGDLILTRSIARIAVPFFLMTTGFFTLSRYHRDNSGLRHFLKKTGMIYAAAMLLYLPLNIYNGYFEKPCLLPNILKDLVFDGTMYHLWYLPASMLGMVIAWRLVEKLDFSKGLAVAALLYLIGLFGDSYYGIAAGVPVIKDFYGLLFQLLDYTRNGVFFAPVFLMFGGYMAEKKPRLTQKQSLGGFALSLAAMTAEALLLHQNRLPRHDSMYLLLPLCMMFLFRTLLFVRGKEARGLRAATLVIYLIHPMIIVAVRAAAKLTHRWALLVENSLIHFAVVCVMSVLFGFAGAILLQRFAVKQKHITSTERAYIELNLTNLAHNAAVLQAAMPRGCKLMAVVKTNAYGHGDYETAVHLERNGVTAFAVATAEEGIRLRRYGIRGDILILGFTDIHRARDLKKYRLTQTLIDYDYAERLNEQGIPIHIHIGIDSGMHRLGIAWDDFESVRRVFLMKHLLVDGMFTHLCCCDSRQPQDIVFTKEQIRRFYTLTDRLKADGISVPKLHIQSSYGLLNYPQLQCDYVRVGISLYGVPSAAGDQTVCRLPLRPVLSVKARVVLIREVPKSECIGYGRAYQTVRDTKVAILPIGYGDGFPRDLSGGKTCVRIGTYIVPIIGRICMDQLAVDITDTVGISVGDTATLIEAWEESPLSASFVAQRSGSISNELLSRLGVRLPVVVTGGQT